MRLTTVLVFFIATSACGFKQAKADAETLASRVHRQIEAGDYKTLYDDSCAQLRKVATEAEFIGMMENFGQIGVRCSTWPRTLSFSVVISIWAECIYSPITSSLSTKRHPSGSFSYPLTTALCSSMN